MPKVNDPFQYFSKQEIRNAAQLLINFNNVSDLNPKAMSSEKAIRSEYFSALEAVLAAGLTKNIKKADLAKLEFSIGRKKWTGAEAVYVAVSMRLIKLANSQDKVLKMPPQKVVKRASKLFLDDELEVMFKAVPALSKEEKEARTKRNAAAKAKTAANRPDDGDRQTALV
tara:strand:- start:933 stop:1442 length:510 start_codon:yes stop_codon:yes gene_type:complete